MNTHIYTLACVCVLALGMGARLLWPTDTLGHDLMLIAVTALLTHGEWLRNQSKGE